MQTDVSAYGMFRNKDEAAQALQALRAKGIPEEEIGVLLPDYDVQDTDFGTAQPRKSITSAVGGGIAGALMGIGIAAFVFVMPGLAAGDTRNLVVAIVGSLFCTFWGAVFGAFIGLRLSKSISQKYLVRRSEHEVVVTVHGLNDMQLADAKDILRTSGGHDVALTGEDSRWRKIFSRWEKIDRSQWPSLTSRPSAVY